MQVKSSVLLIGSSILILAGCRGALHQDMAERIESENPSQAVSTTMKVTRGLVSSR